MADFTTAVPVPLTVLEIGYLLTAFVIGRTSDGEDPVARVLFRKLKAAAIEGGVVWRYGSEPWEDEDRG